MYPSGSVPILQQEVAAFIAATYGLRPAPRLASDAYFYTGIQNSLRPPRIASAFLFSFERRISSGVAALLLT